MLFKKGFFPKGEMRKELVWTRKAVAVFLVAFGLYFASIFFISWESVSRFPELGIRNYELWATILIFLLIFYFVFFIFYSVAIVVLWPVDVLAKAVIIFRAKSKIAELNGGKGNDGNKGQLTIIGIAGSYGKTTMKEVLTQVLGIRYKVLGTPESVNTPVGIARWILNKVSESTEIIVVEMGEHYRGDVAEICEITRPDIVVVTGINESHLERMRTMGTITQTVFEVVSSAKPGASIFLNGDDKNVVEHYKEFVWPDMRVAQYLVSGIKYKDFNTEKLMWEVEFENIGRVEINLLGEYALGNVDAAIKIGLSLGMSGQEIKKGIESIKPVEHRLQPLRSAGDILVIDDSYNGNPDGVAEAVKVLGRFSARGGSASGGANRRKVFITPGLVETGSQSADVHRKIGRQLAGVADVVILIRNSVTGYIESGIKNYELGIDAGLQATGYKLPAIHWFNTAQEAHLSLGKILKPGDVVLFQNDWGDQYL